MAVFSSKGQRTALISCLDYGKNAFCVSIPHIYSSVGYGSSFILLWVCHNLLINKRNRLHAFFFVNRLIGACQQEIRLYDRRSLEVSKLRKFRANRWNLHKTFSTPHGGGGPGSGPVGVAPALVDYLPRPRIIKKGDKYSIEGGSDSMGRISGFFGNFGVMMRAYAYILSLGKEQIKHVGELATLNANYVKESLKDCYYLPIEGICKHEFVFDGLLDKSTGVTTLDIAKRLLDYGYHAPTIYFPLLFHQSIMIEPTETESKETLDEFIEVMRTVAHEAIENPDLVKSAPHSTPVRRLDETTAAKNPILRFKDLQKQS